MAANKTVMMAVAGAGALGAAYYALSAPTRPTTTSSSSSSNDSKMPDNKARDKRDMGLSGAGIGATAAAGGTERPIDPSKDRKTQTTAPREKLPSGGVGGGSGAGGHGARSIELPMPSSTNSIGENRNEKGGGTLAGAIAKKGLSLQTSRLPVNIGVRVEAEIIHKVWTCRLGCKCDLSYIAC